MDKVGAGERERGAAGPLQLTEAEGALLGQGPKRQVGCEMEDGGRRSGLDLVPGA